jgi:hypothetical protein
MEDLMLENISTKTHVSIAGFVDDTSFRDRALSERIAQKAYELYLKRGQIDGYDVQDWLEAEKLVMAEMGSKNFMKQWFKTLCG